MWRAHSCEPCSHSCEHVLRPVAKTRSHECERCTHECVRHAKMVPMALLDRIQSDMVAAMKAKEEARLGAIRLIKTALKKHEVDAMKPLDENTEIQVLSTLIKQRRESADMFRKGNRLDLADKEEAELKLIESYMPAAPSDEEIETAIAAA